MRRDRGANRHRYEPSAAIQASSSGGPLDSAHYATDREDGLLATCRRSILLTRTSVATNGSANSLDFGIDRIAPTDQRRHHRAIAPGCKRVISFIALVAPRFEPGRAT